MDISRRGFLSGIIGLCVAPAIVRVSSIMPIKPVAADLDWNAVEIEFNEWLNDPVMVEVDARDLYSAFTAATRRAFVPNCFVHLYSSPPTLAVLLAAKES